MNDNDRIEELLVKINQSLNDLFNKKPAESFELLTTVDVMNLLSISKPKVLQIFSKKGSPAFKTGTGKGHWRVEKSELIVYLQKQSEQFKS